MPFRYWPVFLAVILTVSCAGPEPLRVTTHVIRDQQTNNRGADPMANNEKLRRLHGAVSMKEREQLLGQYFTIAWHHPEGRGTAPVTVNFDYIQGATGSRIQNQRREFPAEDASGTTEIAVTGDDYFEGGRVLAWQVTLRRGGELIATRQSYLWE